MKKQIRSSLLLLIAAIIWGSAFVAQSEGMAYVEPFTFCGIRFLIGSVVLLPFVSFMKKKETGNGNLLQDFDKSNGIINGIKGFYKIHRELFVGSVLCGIVLCFATNFQQQGMKYVSSVGKAGFITTLYIVLVPILGLFLRKKVRVLVWIALGFAVAGLYFLCITDTIILEPADIFLILCALCFALQIIFVDMYAPKVNCVALSSLQFFLTGVISVICMFIFEKPTIAGIIGAAIPILYAGVMSSGIAFTLQVIAQKDLDPTLASMIMSLESVVSVLSGMLLLGQKLSVREIIGCILMFTGVILSQLPEKSDKETNK